MSKIYNDIIGSVRLLKKVGGNQVVGPDKYHGATECDIDLRITKHRCRFCGMDMTPLYGYGNNLVWKCDSAYCINNPDSKLKGDLTGKEFTTLGNLDRTFQDWRPKTLI